MSSKKIWQYPEATSITNDDYILMDSNTETGSQCLKANKIGAVHITKTVTERKVYKASDDNANGFSEVTVAVPYTDVHYDKDDIVSFIGENLPLKSVTAYIEPQQDLHGYDAPWVGGAGKNKLQVTGTTQTINGVTFTVNNDGTIKVNGTATADARFVIGEYILKAGSSVILNGSPVDGSTSTIALGYQGYGIVSTANSDRVCDRTSQSTDWDNDIYINVASGYTANNLTFKPMIRLASEQDATFEPYSNICPISGWDECNVGVSGVNVWDEEWEQGVISITTGQNVSGNGIRSKNYSNCKGNTSYYFSVGQTADYIMWYDKDKNFINHTYADSSKVVTSPSNAYYFKIRIDSISTYSNNVSVNYPSTDTEYHAYNPNSETITIQLGDTYYGGTLDVVSGVLTVDRAIVDMGDLYWSYTSDAKLFTANIQGIKSGVYTDTNLISSIYPVKPMSYSQFDYGIRYNSATSIGVKDERYTDASAFKTAMNGVQLVYELATPLTIQLTPTQVSSLMGVNNVWADTGEIAVEWQTLYVTPTT